MDLIVQWSEASKNSKQMNKALSYKEHNMQ